MFFSGTVQASEQKTTSMGEQATSIVVNDPVKQQAANSEFEQNKESSIAAETGKLGNLPGKTIKTPAGKVVEIKNIKPERKLPANYKTITITGESKATETQAVAFLKKNTKDMNIKLKSTPEEIVRYYYEESAREGIRADLALCQGALGDRLLQVWRYC